MDKITYSSLTSGASERFFPISDQIWGSLRRLLKKLRKSRTQTEVLHR